MFKITCRTMTFMYNVDEGGVTWLFEMVSPFIKQAWTMSAVLINMLGQGMVLSYPNSLLPALNQPDSPIKVDLNSSSWLGSIAGVSCIPGFLISSVFMSLYGRKKTHAIAILPGIIGWLFIYFAKDFPMLMIGRFLSSMSSGATVSLGAIVMGEYTCPEYRGVFLYLKNASVFMGATVMHVVSQYLHWRTIALVSLVPFFLALIIIFTWPESPAWLASKQQYKKSEESFYWLRGNNENSCKEIEEIIKVQKTEILKTKIKSNYWDKVKEFLRKFTRKDFIKPFIVMMLAAAVLELSGRHIFPTYALEIMADITEETTSSFYYTVGFDIIITFSATFAACLVKILNRRTLLFSTGFAALVVLMTFCLYIFMLSKDMIPNDKPWAPISLLLLYFILANLGCAPIPLALVGEVFPLAHKEAGSALSGVWISICMLVGLHSAPYLLANIGVYGLFAVCGSSMGIALLILFFIMPETKDKTLQEIQSYFKNDNFRNDAGEVEIPNKTDNKNDEFGISKKLALTQ